MLLNLKYGKERISRIANDYKYVNEVMSGKEVLSGEDGILIKEYFKNLGASDSVSQIDYLNEKKSALKKLKEESMLDYKKYSSLYIKIALMAGILIAVLLA